MLQFFVNLLAEALESRILLVGKDLHYATTKGVLVTLKRFISPSTAASLSVIAINPDRVSYIAQIISITSRINMVPHCMRSWPGSTILYWSIACYFKGLADFLELLGGDVFFSFILFIASPHFYKGK